MSYNLLFDTNFTTINKHWKLTNCEYVDGYLVGHAKTYSIEQEITLPDPTRLYASFEYLTFDKNIKHVYCGIISNDVMEVNRKKPVQRKRKRVAVVTQVSTEQVRVMFTFEAKTETSRIYIDSPLLIDLTKQNKSYWPLYVLNNVLDYRYGYDYTNMYHESEITFDNTDFHSPFSNVEQGKCGIIVTTQDSDWFEISLQFKQGTQYLVKLDYSEVNDFGQLQFNYGSHTSQQLTPDQLYMVFRGDASSKLRLNISTKELLPYIVNIKHLLIIEMTHQKIEEDDLKHLPFI